MRKVLVANRGEIALRVMQACREEGLATVAVYMAGEENPLHARYADEAIQLVSDQQIGYLDIKAIVRAAVATNADAIHPGYGFLAENAVFARACVNAGFVFIGPPAGVIATMGDKVQARAAAIRAGVPIVPGSDHEVDVDAAIAFGRQHGFPIALKATGGGGGRGFRVIDREDGLAAAFESASSEAARNFNNPALYVERYLDRPRHVEIQVMADRHGNVVGLGERECSIQRRHQKLVEESPSPAVDDRLRARMNEAAVSLAASVGYSGAGTVEFLVIGGEFYFLEMNTRIQVEHPVTEQVTGVDLVREQLRVAAGGRLSVTTTPRLAGHAIECRINAEDPARDYAPAPGTITTFVPPTGFGVRVDSGVETGSPVDPRFDNLIAKLVVTGRDRKETLERLRRALDDFTIEGVATTIPLFQLLLRQSDFLEGAYDTGYLERSELISRLTPFEAPEELDEPGTIIVKVDGRPYRVTLPDELATNPRTPARSGQRSRQRRERRSKPTGAELTSPIQGTVLAVQVAAGQTVTAGQLVCVIEAMKMENEIVAHRDGRISEIAVEAGQTVNTGDRIAVIGAPTSN